ncbi:MAG: glycosyltransferase family 39 protein [Roseiflexus sp.]|nr:glycosyltransferase family 39 protein [Roseiflexus sp.]MCS7291328.1 glycosyltransferase family 39 protein [Roseiflexus sp.]MDW8232911.1 glycosyltransferase family 39 protein [Roseiflexaceae bacterium]
MAAFKHVLSRHAAPVAPMVIFLLAMIARWPNGAFLTVDEAYHWIALSKRFATALSTGNFADTFYFGHPAITTLWLGIAGHWMYETLSAAEVINEGWDIFYTLMRLPAAVLTALAVAISYPLLKRLFGVHIALIAALLWIGEPFLVAHSQLFHMDATLTSLMTVSLLLMLIALKHAGGSLSASPWWIGSGAAFGLGLLTKSPALLLAPMAGLIALIRQRDTIRDIRSFVNALLRCVLPLFVWGGVAAVMWVALWPAMWVRPVDTIQRVLEEIFLDGGAPHPWGNFFLGRAVDDPGPLFYLVVIAFRLAPWTLIGVLLWIGFTAADGRRAWSGSNRWLLLLAVFIVLFVAAITVMAKKFDRYALPVFPALTILAAAGICRTADFLWRRLRRGVVVPTQRLVVAGYALIVAGLAANLYGYYPYYLAYYSPLFGGGPMAEQILPIGWGEGLELAAAFIASQPDGRDRPIAVFYQSVLRPFAPAGVAPLQAIRDPRRVDYAVTYIDQLQRNTRPELHQPFHRLTPLHVVRIHGINYAYVYHVPPPVAYPLSADFGDAIHLLGYDLDASAVRSSNALTITLEWHAHAPVGADYFLFIHVLNERAERVAQIDVPLDTGRWPSRMWRPGRFFSTLHRVPLPPDLPAGTYRLAMGIYDPHTFVRLPLRTDGERAEDAGDHALLLTRITIP